MVRDGAPAPAGNWRTGSLTRFANRKGCQMDNYGIQEHPPGYPGDEPQGSLMMGIVGGLVAALVGGFIWAMIAIVTDYEVGIVAIGIGVLTGFAVVIVSGGGTGILFQLVAVVSSVLGVLFGKYYIFVHYVKEFMEGEYGAEAADSISLFAADTIDLFVENAGDLFGGYDILWVILAVVAAWKIPAVGGDEDEEEEGPSEDEPGTGPDTGPGAGGPGPGMG